MARCNDCNRFVSMEPGDSPELDIDIDQDGTINGSVTFTRNCAECGTELRQGQLDLNVSIPEVMAHAAKHTEAYEEAEKEAARKRLAAFVGPPGEAIPGIEDEDQDDIEEFELSIENEEAEVVEGGTSRKPTLGFHATFTVVCTCGAFEHDGEADDSMACSDMDEL